MSIKKQVLKELKLKKALKQSQGRMTYKEVAKEAKVNYTTLLRWVNGNNKSISTESLEKIATALGKKFILVDEKL